MSKLKELAGLLKAAKESEAAARAYREQIEGLIYTAFEEEQTLPDRGIVRGGGIKMTLKENESWDDAKLTVLSREIPPELFPFKASWKCDARARNKLAKLHPDLYRKIYPALTVRRAKPHFELEEPSDEAAAA